MPEPIDNTGAWIELLLEVVGTERYDRLSGMTPEEKNALVLRLLGDRERFVGVIRKLVGLTDDVETHLGFLFKGAEEALVVIGDADV